MAEFTSYPPGVPSWVDLASADVEATKRFYVDVFGWEAGEASAEGGGYFMFMKNSKPVAGCMPLMQEGQPPVWMTYVSTDNADATVDAAKGAGATVFAEPMDVLDAGRLAVFADPTGAAIGIWQPNQFPGAALANEPGTLVWNELHTRDVSGAKSFYRDVFGWEANDADMGPVTYTELKLKDRTVAGMMPMADEMPAAMPPFWLAYFAVDDCDATVKKANSLGATSVVPPTDIPPGRFSVLSDNSGATFAVIKTSMPAQ
jgi:uncharacterized protein